MKLHSELHRDKKGSYPIPVQMKDDILTIADEVVKNASVQNNVNISINKKVDHINTQITKLGDSDASLEQKFQLALTKISNLDSKLTSQIGTAMSYIYVALGLGAVAILLVILQIAGVF